MEKPDQPEFYPSAKGRIAWALIALCVAGLTPAQADLTYTNDYSAKVQLSPDKLVLKCVEQLRPKSAKKVTLELVEVPEINIEPGASITGWVIYVGEMEQFSNLGALMKKVAPPQHLHMLNQRFKGRMKVKYHLEGSHQSDERMIARGYKRMDSTRNIQVGGDENGFGAKTVKIASWYKHNSAKVPSYGSTGATITLRSQTVGIDTEHHRYVPKYRLLTAIDYTMINRPTSAEGRLISSTLERQFKERMVQKTKAIIDWLNQNRVLLTNEEVSQFGGKAEGTNISSDVTEINFRFCGKPQTVTPDATVIVGPWRYVSDQGALQDAPFRD